jgi:predicted ArsR family transcriptional regulator
MSAYRNTTETDSKLLDVLRVSGAQTVSSLAEANSVTPTAIRQRLNRLMAEGLIERNVTPSQRGRPSHRYSLTEKARRQTGSNFADLAVALWQEIRAVKDPEVRQGLLSRVTQSLAANYRSQVRGANLTERMESIQEIFADRGVPFSVDDSGGLPVLSAHDCPYPQLAEQDRGICAVERMLFADLLSEPVRLSQCRLDGHACCQFQTN